MQILLNGLCNGALIALLAMAFMRAQRRCLLDEPSAGFLPKSTHDIIECGFKEEALHTPKKERNIKHENGSVIVKVISWIETIARKDCHARE